MKKNYFLVGTIVLSLVAGFSIGYFVAKPTPENKLTYALLNGRAIGTQSALEKISIIIDSEIV